MGKNEANVGVIDNRAVVQQARDRTCGIGNQFNAVDRVFTVLAYRVGIDDRPPAVQLVHHRCEHRVAEVDAVIIRHHRDAVDIQYIEGVLDLAERILHGG